MVKESGGPPTDSQDRHQQRWTRHFKEYFSRPTAIVSRALTSTSETIQMDIGLTLEIEIIRQIGFLNGYRVSGPDELSPSFFKDSDVVLKS